MPGGLMHGDDFRDSDEEDGFSNRHESGMDLMDDFIFSETETIGTVIHTEYRQDQKIRYKSMREDSKQDGDMILAKHLVDIKGVRFLYTKKIHELIQHHFVKGFDFSKFRRTDYADSLKKSQKHGLRDKRILESYDGSNRTGRKFDAETINYERLLKECLICGKLEQAQVNFQNGRTESQMLIASPTPVICALFTYQKKPAPSPEQKHDDALGFKEDPLARDQFSLAANTAAFTGYRFSADREVIKYETFLDVRQMDCYVAPTFINLENPTFWMNHDDSGVAFQPTSQAKREEKKKEHVPAFSDFNDSFGERKKAPVDKNTGDYWDYCHNSSPAYDDCDSPPEVTGENLLRKIILFYDISFSFEFLSLELVDHQLPRLKLDILIERLEGQLNSTEWWHFCQIINAILLNRGEKAAEVTLIEKWRASELKRLNQENIRDIIFAKLKNQYKEQQNLPKPDLARYLNYNIRKANLSLNESGR
jgi:hypothetical protein